MQRGFYYEVDYGKYSQNSSHYYQDRPAESIQEAKMAGIEEAVRLAKNGNDIQDVRVYEYCKGCDGRGVIYVPYKRIKYKKQEKKCPDCKGKNALVQVI